MNDDALEHTAQWEAHFAAADLLGPDVIQLELAAACDLRCVMCPLPHETRFGGDAVRWNVGELEALADAFAEASGVELTGFGEILCHPRLPDCLRWFRRRDLAVQATTNGQRLTAALARAIIDEQLIDALCVSVDAVTAATYERIRRGGDFARLQRNLDQLAAARAGAPLRLWLSFAAMRDNLPELPEFVRWAANLGAERVIAQHVFAGPHAPDQGLDPSDVEAAAALREAGRVADDLGIALDGRNMATQGAGGFRPGLVKDCPFPWGHAFIKANRRVAACAMVWEDLDLADLGAGGFGAIWRSEAYRRFRGDMARGDTPAPCVRCCYFGWREATPLSAVGAELPMSPDRRGQLGSGWHGVEAGASGGAFRWTRRRAAAFLNPRGRPILEIDALTHAQAPYLRGEVRAGEARFDFDSNDLWGAPLRLPIGATGDSAALVEISLERDWNPHKVGIAGRRRLGLMVSGVRFVGDAAGFASTVDAEDPRGQLGRGWLPAEDVNGRRARWMRERADLLLRGTAGELRVEAMLPPGLPPGRLQALVDGADAGTRALPADGAWRSLTFARVTASGLARVELRAPTATPAPGDAAAHPRRFGALVARVGF